MAYLITYDLHKRRDYAALYRLMASWRATRLTESLWLASLVGPAATIRNIVAANLDHDDTVAVLEVKHGSDWATLRVSPAANAALSTYIAPGQLAA